MRRETMKRFCFNCGSGWSRFIAILLCMAVVFTMYAPALPAMAMETEPIACSYEEHTHGEACYGTQTLRKLECPKYGRSETVVHTHDALCEAEDGSLACTLTERKAHAHGDECYAPVPVCTEQESETHTHGEGCYSAEERTLVCTEEELVLHSHTEECMYFSEDPDVMPVLVCELPVVIEHIHTEECAKIETVQVLICTVKEHTHGDGCELIPEEINHTAETENYVVSVTYSSDLNLPESVELRVLEYARDSEVFRQRCAEVGYELEWLLNIGLYEGETELELHGGFNVVVTPKQGGVAATDITHFAEEGVQHIDGVDEGDAVVSFETDSFSDFGGGIMLLAAGDTATLNLNIWAYSNNQVIQFSGGNNVSCSVGSTVTFVMRDSGGTYVRQNLTYSGCELVSAVHSCNNGTSAHGNNSWCNENPVYTFTVRITSANASVSGDIGWLYGGNNTYSVSGGTGGSTNPGTTPTTGQVRDDLPTAVTTGSVNVEALRFYNLCESGEDIGPLAGCVFEVVRIDNNGNPIGEKLTITSGNTPEVMLPQDLPNGKYRITEVSVPTGYMRDTEYQREFVVNNGKFDHNDNIGTFINHNLMVLNDAKTAEVENYNNRIYQVLMEAENHMRMFEMDPIDVLFVVDQSNSMLFPSGLTSTGKTITLHKDGAWNGGNNSNNMNALGLSKDEVYYIISDPQGTSTVFAIYWDDQLRQWMYQDASYYAKAKHNNATGYKDPNETAIFPGNRSFTDQKNSEKNTGTKSNGGALNLSMNGSSLYTYIGTGSNAYTEDFVVYTASNEYNRLHYLEEAMTNMVYELANANDQNRVTLVGFTKSIMTWRDANGNQVSEGPYYLTPDNTELLVSMVSRISTAGGTRQDIGLKRAYEAHLNNAAEGFNRGVDHTHTILITDGAPVRSGSDAPALGSANSSPTTASNGEIYGQIKGWANQVKTKSNLMTVGLGMKDVAGGHAVLSQIASGEHFCALDDAADLVHEMQKLMFDNFRPKDPIFLYGDVVDEISDSFYPIAWVPAGQAAATGRMVLNLQNEPNTNNVFDPSREWIMLQAGDWITLDGRYTTADASDKAGQLQRKADGTFYITWTNANISDAHLSDNVRIAWVPKGSSTNGKDIIASDDTRDWILLNTDDWISQQGQYQTTAPNRWNQGSYGQIKKNGDAYYVKWGTSANGNNRITYEFPGWDATFYVKAKEDFIGGNAIDTNKNAYITVRNTADITADMTTGTREFDKPTVNVRLLDMNEMSSEVTVYLGDTINGDNAPIDSVQDFYRNTQVQKILSGDGNVLNKVRISDADGLGEASFYLRYAMGRDLTEAEWNTLKEGGTITVEYTYDAPSSRGPVGYFTFSLTKQGNTADYNSHVATEACQPGGQPLTEDCDRPAETYTLNVSYTAYRLGENGRAPENVFNGSGSPGTEVGTGRTLPTGLGKVEKHDIHEVHVISGIIRIYKQVGDEGTNKRLSFTFNLHRVENGTDQYDETRTVIIPAGHAGPISVEFYGLYRGTYVITEQEDPESGYKLTKLEIMDSTNCENTRVFTGEEKSVTFVMGDNVDGNNVIGKDKNGAGVEAKYTSYIDPVNGVLGEVIFTNTAGVELPVTGGSGIHLYQFSGLLLGAAALIYGCALRRRNRKEAKN